MSDDDRSEPSPLKSLGGVLLAVILINVLLRVLPLPEIDLPAISLPDVPAWVHAVVQVKNWALGAIIVVVIVGVAIDQHVKRAPEPADGEDQAR